MKPNHEWSDVSQIIQIIDIREILPNPENPRKITPAKFNELVKSIEADPQILLAKPLVIDENKMVLGGNQRLTACKKIGMKTVPCLNASMLTPEQREKFIAIDNTHYGEWDWVKLEELYTTEQLYDYNIQEQQIMVDGETTAIDQSEIETINQTFELATELKIGDNYLVVVFRDNEQYQKAVEELKLPMVKTNHHTKDSLNETGIKRVLFYDELKPTK